MTDRIAAHEPNTEPLTPEQVAWMRDRYAGLWVRVARTVRSGNSVALKLAPIDDAGDRARAILPKTREG